jgi:hypothetical protein
MEKILPFSNSQGSIPYILQQGILHMENHIQAMGISHFFISSFSETFFSGILKLLLFLFVEFFLSAKRF